MAPGHQFIDAHLTDPDLSSKVPADAHVVSHHSIQKLVEESGTPVATTVRTRRLQRCRQALAVPAIASVPISLIGRRWALPDGSHFSRSFSGPYGQSPRDDHQAALPPATIRAAIA